MSTNLNNHPIVLFDGVCNLCNSSVQFIIKSDMRSKIKFAALQSSTGQELLKKYNLPSNLSTVIVLDNGKHYTKSDAAIHIASILGGWLSVLRLGKLLPKSFRNRIYDWVAANRYHWFGKKEYCWIPTPELKARFL